MGFMDEVKTEAQKYANGAVLTRLKATLDKKEFAEFVEAVKDAQIPCTAIQRVLKSRGIACSENTIRKFRSQNVFE